MENLESFVYETLLPRQDRAGQYAGVYSCREPPFPIDRSVCARLCVYHLEEAYRRLPRLSDHTISVMLAPGGVISCSSLR